MKFFGRLKLGLAVILLSLGLVSQSYAAIDVVEVSPGNEIRLLAGEDLSTGDVVYIKAADGKFWKADTDLSIPAWGIVKAGSGGSVSAGAGVNVAKRGKIIGDSGLTINGDVFLTATAGTYDQTGVTAFKQRLGVAISATKIIFDIGGASGNIVAGTLSTTGAASLGTTLDVTGAVGIDGNFDIATNKWTINATTGNAQGAGTLGVTGAVTLSSNTTVGGTLGVTGAVTMTTTLTITGDIVAGGGFTMPATLMTNNVTNSASAVAIYISGSSTVQEIEIPWAGSITGISVLSNESRSGGTLTVDATINGSVTGLQAVLDGSNADHHSATQAKDVDAFSAGDRLGVKVTTDASWAPVTADIIVVIWYESGGAS